MSYTDDFLNGLKKRGINVDGLDLSTSGDKYVQDFISGLEKRKKKKAEELITKSDDIGPVREEEEEEEEEEDERRWFEKGAFEDGYDFGDITKTILGSLTDARTNFTSGVLGMGESAVDSLLSLAPYMTQAQYYANGGGYNPQADEAFKQANEEGKALMSEWAKKDLYDEKKVASWLVKNTSMGGVIGQAMGVDEEDSVFGDKTDSLVQSGGQLAATAGLAYLGVPWFLTTGVTTHGSEVENALKQGATLDEANLSGLISAGAEILTEKISGGVKLPGIGKTMDDMLPSLIGSNIANKTARTVLKLIGDAGGEGLEEVLSGALSAVGQKLTYADEKELSEIFSTEDAFESFIGGAVLGGGSNVIGAVKSKAEGKDSVTGLTKDEQNVAEKILEKYVQSKGGKVSAKEKAAQWDKITTEMEKGYISAEDIEAILGGESYTNFKAEMDSFFQSDDYKAYQDAVKTEEAARKEFDPLVKMKQGEMTGEQIYRRDELKKILDESKVKELETKLSPETERIMNLRNLMRSEVFERVKGTKLEESYNELARKQQKYEVDVEQYEGKAKETVQNIIDSGLGDNSNQFHELVDFLAKISNDKGVTFNFTKTELLKGTKHYKEGYITNGFVDDNGNVVLNKDSNNAIHTIVGHEVTHVLEQTDSYKTLQAAVRDYCIAKEGLAKYNARLKAAEEAYKGKKNTTPEGEVTADIIGEYLFTDSEFVNKLSIDDRSTFEKIYDEIKYLWKVATAGSHEKRELERVKKIFDKAWRENVKGKAEATPEEREFSDADTKYSIRKEAPPKETGIAYKVFFVKDGKLYPPMVANPDGESTPMGVWLDADVGVSAPPSKTGRAQVKAGGKGTQGGSGSLAFRPGWHLGDLPRASQFDRVNPETGKKELFPENFVWAEVEYAKDVDYQEEAMSYGYTKNGKFRHAYAGLPRLPENGYYRYRTNPKPDTVPWIITGAMKVNRLLSDAEVNSILEQNGIEPVHRQGGDVELDKFGISEAQNENGLDRQSEVTYSLSRDAEFADKAIEKNLEKNFIPAEVMEAQKLMRERVAAKLKAIQEKGLVGLPEDIEGNTFISNSSYGGTEENTTICPRSLASEAFVDAVSEYLGRPLTVEEQIYISQDLQGRSMTPECTYCYVATDRKAYRAFLGEYIKQRDAVLEKLKANPKAHVSKKGELYQEFLGGRKDTKQMYGRFKMWVDAYKSGAPMISASHLANVNRLMGDINSEFGEELKPQIVDAMKYAQSASWAKKRVNYVAYNGHILNWKQDRIDKLNSHYGLRMYSFSDFHPAFVLENMQMITDASVRGLKMLGYTKDTDFVEIFAPSGMNINVSTFGFESGGNVYENNIIGAEWAKAKELRAKHPNVGITFVATNDTLVNWALDQDWIDVVIPYHLVRTGAEVAKAFGYTNYTSESADTKGEGWKKGDKKSIAPTEHNNDLDTYFNALAENHLNPRFERFKDHPNYMKLVNECRLSASESKPVQPIFNEEAANNALAKLEANGYYQPIGGSVERMYEIAAEVAEDMSKAVPHQYSFTKDSDGKQLSEDQGEFFANSKARSETGELLVLYHGSRSPLFTEFDLYEGVWLTPDQRYAEIYAEQWHSWRDDFDDAPVRKDLNGLEPSVYADPDYRLYKMYANITNPANIGDLDGWLSDGKVQELAKALGVRLHELKPMADKYMEERTYMLTRSHEFIELAKANGFDGFVATEGGVKSFCAFGSPNQVKLTSNEVPSAFYDVRYSMSKDSDGNDLTAEQQEFFRDSVIRDENGSLMPMYHGTKKGGFTVFDGGKDYWYFTKDKKYADTFEGRREDGEYYPLVQEGIDEGYYTPQKYAVYLNVKNPFITDDIDVIEDALYWDKTLPEQLRKQGYDALMLEDMSQVIVLNPNQIKNMDNANPTEDSDIRYSLTKADSDYMDAVNRGDTETAQMMVDEAAKNAGYTSPMLFHGTSKFGFTKFDPAFSDDKMSIFLSSNNLVAETYSGKTEKYKVSQRSTITPEGLDKASPETILKLLQENVDYRIEMIGEGETKQIIKKHRSELKNAIRMAEQLPVLMGDKWNDIAQKDLDKVIASLRNLAEASTYNEFMDAYNDYEGALFDMRWENDTATNVLYELIRDDVQSSYRGLTNYLDTTMYRGNTEYTKRNGKDIFNINEAVSELYKVLFRGVYQLYTNPGNQLVINAEGSNWNQINGKHINASGPVRTRDVAKYAKENGYDSVLIKNLRDSGDYSYMGTSDVYIFFGGDRLKSADPVTYDDKGKIIPLSERFKKDNDDIRYSLSPEDAAPGYGYVPSRDIGVNDEFAPIREDAEKSSDGVAPDVGVAENETTTEEYPIQDEENLEKEKAKLAEEFQRRREELTELLRDKNAFFSKRASELYLELRGLKKGVKASDALGYLLDTGYEWSSIRSALVNIRHTPGERVNMNSAVESIARQMLNEEYEDLQYDLDDLDAEYEKQVKELEKNARKPRMTRKGLHESLVEDIRGEFARRGADFDEVLKKAKNLSTFATVDNTPQRVMEKSFGYKEGGILADLTVNKVAQNETEGIKWLNTITDRKNGLLAHLSKKYHIKPGSKESAAAQMYAEGFYVNENNEIIAYGDNELAKDFPDINVQRNIKGLAKDERVRKFYDDTLTMINESRTRNLYPEIPRLENYHLHFRAMDDTFSKLGLPFNPNDIRAKDLPTDLNGVTADLKPGQPYFASAKHREGKRTSFDILGGLERYATSAKNQIFHIDDIQTLRALRNYLADTYGQANGLEGLDELTEEEAQERIKEVYSSHLSTFAKFLNEEANVLAGKTALIDRGIEGIIGRRGITFLDTINRQVGSNAVGYSASSAIVNFDAIPRAFVKANKADFVKAFGQMVVNAVSRKSDGFAENSPVALRRKGAERFHRTLWQKMSDPGYALMGKVDEISTELIARAKYNELTRKGMDAQKAHFETDKWVSKLMGDRSLGQQPQIFNSKMLGLLTKFQLEVRNNLDSMFYDTIQEAKVSNEHIQGNLERNARTAAKATATIAGLAIAQHIFGKAFESVAGYNPSFDIIEAIIKAFGWDDEEEEPILDNLEEAFLTVVEDMPYSSVFTGGRIPIQNALPIKELVTGIDEYGNEKSRWETLGEIAPYYLMPGGYGQIKKTVQGLGMFLGDHPIDGSYTDSGNLRFPVEDTFGNVVQAGLFGQYASKNARDYFDNDWAPLADKQIDEYSDLGMDFKQYHEIREGLKDYDTLAEKVDYINGLDISDEQKNILVNNLTDRKTPIDMSNYGEYGSFEEFDYAQKNPDKYEFFKGVGISYDDYASADEEGKREYSSMYEWVKDNPGKYEMSKAISDDFLTYWQYKGEMGDLKADKDSDGKTISGSKKEKVIDYINNLDLDYGQKIILFRSMYDSKADREAYNSDILEYLNSRDDISYEEMVTILTELGFKVNGNQVTWD